MSLCFPNLQPAFGSHSLRWLVRFFVVTGMVLAFTLSARASIMLPDAPEFSLDDLTENSSASDSRGSSSASTDRPIKTTDSEKLKRPIPSDALTPGGSSTGTSTTTSGNSMGGAGASALDCVAPILFSGPTVVGRVSGEQPLALPTPPGNNLLRPPQQWNCS